MNSEERNEPQRALNTQEAFISAYGNSVIITRDWVFGRYQREITFDKIQDVHVQQGILAGHLVATGRVAGLRIFQ
ncbi:MAG: hypothetical protein QXH02_07295 [Desulfurococcaceae archaeon]